MIVFELGDDDLFEKKESRRRNGGFGSILRLFSLCISEYIWDYYSSAMLCLDVVESRMNTCGEDKVVLVNHGDVMLQPRCTGARETCLSYLVSLLLL